MRTLPLRHLWIVIALLLGVFLSPAPTSQAQTTLPREEYVTRIARSGDGRVIAVAYSDVSLSAVVDFFDGTDGHPIGTASLAPYSLSLISLSPTGDRLLWSDVTGRVGVYDRTTGHTEIVVQQVLPPPESLTWSPVADIAAWSVYTTTTFYDMGTYQKLGELVTTAGTGNLAWSPDGQRMVTSHYASYSDPDRELRAIQIWNEPTMGGRRRTPFVALEDRGGGMVTWNPDGTRIAVLEGQGFLVYDLNTRALTTIDFVDGPGQSEIRWSPDGSQLAIGGSALHIWDTITWQRHDIPTENWASTLQWSASGEHLFHDGGPRGLYRDETSLAEVYAVPGADPGPRIEGFVLLDTEAIPLSEGDVIDIANLHVFPITMEAITSSGKVGSVAFNVSNSPSIDNEPPFAVTLSSGEVSIIATAFTEPDAQGQSGPPITLFFRACGFKLGAIAWSPDGTWIAIGKDAGWGCYSQGGGSVIQIIDASSGEIAYTLGRNSYTGTVTQLSWNSESTRLVGAEGWGRQAYVWNTEDWSALSSFQENQSPEGFLDVVWAPYHNLIASTADSPGVRIWDPDTGDRLRTIDPGEIYSIAWKSDGTLLTVGGANITLWDAQDGTLQRTLPTGALHMAWSPDDSRLATISRQQPGIRLLDGATGEVVTTLEGSPDLIYILVWNQDNRRLATVGYDDVVRIWDTATGEQLAVYQHSEPMYAVDWSPDGSRLAYGGSGGVLHIVDAPQVAP